jgi:hypothetical protein
VLIGHNYWPIAHGVVCPFFGTTPLISIYNARVLSLPIVCIFHCFVVTTQHMDGPVRRGVCGRGANGTNGTTLGVVAAVATAKRSRLDDTTTDKKRRRAAKGAKSNSSTRSSLVYTAATYFVLDNILFIARARRAQPVRQTSCPIVARHPWRLVHSGVTPLGSARRAPRTPCTAFVSPSR